MLLQTQAKTYPRYTASTTGAECNTVTHLSQGPNVTQSRIYPCTIHYSTVIPLESTSLLSKCTYIRIKVYRKKAALTTGTEGTWRHVSSSLQKQPWTSH